MKLAILALLLAGAAITAAQAQDAVPDIQGQLDRQRQGGGVRRSCPSSRRAEATDPPRTRNRGDARRRRPGRPRRLGPLVLHGRRQQGALRRWLIASEHKSIVGAEVVDGGYFRITLLGARPA